MEVKQKKATIAAKALRNVISWMMIETRAREKRKNEFNSANLSRFTENNIRHAETSKLMRETTTYSFLAQNEHQHYSSENSI